MSGSVHISGDRLLHVHSLSRVWSVHECLEMCTHLEIHSSVSSICLECPGVSGHVHIPGDLFLHVLHLEINISIWRSLSPSRDQYLRPEMIISIWISISPPKDQYLRPEINISVRRSIPLSHLSIWSVQECLNVCTIQEIISSQSSVNLECPGCLEW